eukprot:TRINITY_DN5594_c0_g1_i6.p2 TRINITY_DN5594_c0_g1~~TRINITY_DN5594_c0_g1_i6.p2  ORF type:complete len:254 (+),score=25.22 TRINITY_DN5594_c0_g1_i6:72-833(+)
MLASIHKQFYPSLSLPRNLTSCISTTANCTDLKQAVRQKIPEEFDKLQQLKSEFGNTAIDKVSVTSLLGGLRGVTALLWETSLLDPELGIRYRGYSIQEIQQQLPPAFVGGQPLPEGLLWLFITGDIPTKQQVLAVQDDLRARQKPVDDVLKVLRNLPEGTHPMTQFPIGVMSLPSRSHFAYQYYNGLRKSEYWEPIYEDTMDLMANLPIVAAVVYRNAFKKGGVIPADAKLDWAANLVHIPSIQITCFGQIY